MTDATQTSGSLVIMLTTGTRQALHHGLSLALVALADGDKVALTVFYDALEAYLAETSGRPCGFGDGAAAEVIEAGFRSVNLPAVTTLVTQCREIGGERFRVVGCGAAVEVSGANIDELVATEWFDDVVGLPTIWRWAKRGRVVGV